jgi:membrane protein YqaA with SNARE-associated domain
MDLTFLFISAFAASTILPMSSEVVLGTLARSGSSEVWLLLAVATAGNTLGAVVNWGIGRYASTWRTRLHSLEEAKFERACRWFSRWGIWCSSFTFRWSILCLFRVVTVNAYKPLYLIFR